MAARASSSSRHRFTVTVSSNICLLSAGLAYSCPLHLEPALRLLTKAAGATVASLTQEPAAALTAAGRAKYRPP